MNGNSNIYMNNTKEEINYDERISLCWPRFTNRRVPY